MPGGDRTGPLGMGPMTGRAAGYCAGYPVPGFMNPIPGRGGWGMGWGRGRGFAGGRGMGRGWRRPGYGYGGYPYAGFRGWAYPGGGVPAWDYPQYAPAYAPDIPTAEEEGRYLKERADFLHKELEEIERRISDLESKAEDK